ncbi:MAG: hypothetical protein ACLUSX_11570 [Ruminococcus sp.]
MSEEQYKKVIDALVDFVLRVATKMKRPPKQKLRFCRQSLTFLAKFRN